jgi:hypothetical protein
MLTVIPSNVVSYTEFLERRERRHRVASEFRRQSAKREAKPISCEQKSQYDPPSRITLAERTT